MSQGESGCAAATSKWPRAGTNRRSSSGHFAPIGLIHAARLEDAERSLATAKTLLDVAEISGKERARLEEEVDEVRSALARCAMPAA